MDIFDLIRSKYLKGIREWVENKNINKNVVVDTSGDTPLHFAIFMYEEKAAEVFVKNNLYIQSADYYNNTPLHLAALHGFADLVSFLIEKGAHVDIVNKFGRAALHCAAWNGLNHTVLVLIENGAKINVFDEDEETPLEGAIYWLGNVETVKTLLNEGASLLTHDNNGNHYLRSTKNDILLVKHHLKLQKFVVHRKKLFLTSRVFLKFLNTFKFSFNK